METRIASLRALSSSFVTKRAALVTSPSSTAPGDAILASRGVIFRCFDVVYRSIDAIDGSTDDGSRTRDVAPRTKTRVDGSRDAVPRRRNGVDDSRDVARGPGGRHFSVQRRRLAVDGRRLSNRRRRDLVGRRKIGSARRSLCVGERLRSSGRCWRAGHGRWQLSRRRLAFTPPPRPPAPQARDARFTRCRSGGSVSGDPRGQSRENRTTVHAPPAPAARPVCASCLRGRGRGGGVKVGGAVNRSELVCRGTTP
jgi:hypothetical protein